MPTGKSSKQSINAPAKKQNTEATVAAALKPGAEDLADSEDAAETTATDASIESSVRMVFDKLREVKISEDDSYFDQIAERLGFSDRIFT
jgi:hypothetical protein